ncbi:probable E3 ubiquitin-protein ligase HERC3 [Macrobrachium rosenbergii]|uniref:probable E3 ubiquitin-protein ligase HERC3 n=1 Tax=Macrobrachium rosenbergii TaxID=79674 RepID=UPI0034D71E29
MLHKDDQTNNHAANRAGDGAPHNIEIHYGAAENTISFCEYPFLFDAQAKTLLLRCDATRQMQGAIQEAVINSNPMLWLLDPAQVQFLNLNIHRNNIVEDTINQLLHHGVTEFKRPLKVHFIGEEAEDAGGVRKEFFLLLLREILNPDFGMFTQYPEKNTIWFKEGSLDEEVNLTCLFSIICLHYSHCY